MMDKFHFINCIKDKRDIAIQGVRENLESPPGRNPRKKDKILSDFYNSLNDDKKEYIIDIISESVDMGIFMFLCILDHVSFVENEEEKTNFELYSIKNSSKILLNDFYQEKLHDIYNSLVQE